MKQMAVGLSRGLAEPLRRAGYSAHSVYQLFIVMDYVTRWRECPGLCVVCLGMTAESPWIPIGWLGHVTSGHCEGS